MPLQVAGCIYPTNAEFRMLQQELMPRYTENRLGFQLMPFAESEFATIYFDRPDIFKGMQQWRGLKQGSKFVNEGRANPYGQRCEVQPGYWGEFDRVEEDLLTRGAQFGTASSVFDLTEHMVRMDRNLLERQYNRIEFNIWRSLVFGEYVAYNMSGQVVFQAQYDIRTISPRIPWSDRDRSTPLRDFRFVRKFGRGTSADFGRGARYIMNQSTADCLFSNQNRNDIGKAGLSACCTFMGPDVVNAQFAAQGLGTVEVYDEGWVDEQRNFNLYIPDGYVVIVGARPGGTPVGHYWYTRNAVGCGITTGPWQKVVDTCEREVPREISVHRGHNGGPAIEYPRSVVILRTGCAVGQDVVVA